MAKNEERFVRRIQEMQDGKWVTIAEFDPPIPTETALTRRRFPQRKES